MTANDGSRVSGLQYDGVGDVLSQGALRSVYQPLVRLEDGAVVGFEALTRGPAGHRLESPLELLAQARTEGLLGELDWACRASALRGAAAATLDPRLSWFVNVEPESLAMPCPQQHLGTMADAADRLRIVVELTERSLVQDPGLLLNAVERVRELGCGVALDDVGAEPASLALLPFVRPDVVKLDMRLVAKHMAREVAAVSSAVRAHTESTGASILAEGIETERDVFVARALGATHGQGWYFGRPGALPGQVQTAANLPMIGAPAACATRTPFEIVTDAKQTSVVEKRLLRPISRHLEDQAHVGGLPTVILACFQHAEFFTPRIAKRYGELASATAFTAALGVELEAEPAPGVRGAVLAADDRLTDEWNVLVVGPHYAGALVARDLGDTGPDPERRFEYAVTHDREVILEASRSLFRWVAPRRIEALDLLGAV
jgi:EAL domain-containing protein (putative c-di-GMP-specific phosphodiesterase class I)